MFGMDEVVRLILTAFYNGGHVLLEGNPGLGKTELVKTLGRALKLNYGRIQFTPDLMPADITGTWAPDYENNNPQRLIFKKGPIFKSLLLADEINRATPKTQSAMLEAMAEKQVTVFGKREKLDLPFMVLATQNPIDHEGTFNLPEAQSDRFMFKITVPVPNRETIRLIMRKDAGVLATAVSIGAAAKTPNPQNPQGYNWTPRSREESEKLFAFLQRTVSLFKPTPSVEIHILNMFLASNRQYDLLQGLDRNQLHKVKQLVDELLIYGLSPRAATAMMLGAKAYSLMFIKDAEGAEGPALARVAIPCLRHRIKLRFDWQEAFFKIEKGAGKDDAYRDESSYGNIFADVLMVRMIAAFCLSTAPAANQYATNFKGELQKAMSLILSTAGERH